MPHCPKMIFTFNIRVITKGNGGIKGLKGRETTREFWIKCGKSGVYVIRVGSKWLHFLSWLFLALYWFWFCVWFYQLCWGISNSFWLKKGLWIGVVDMGMSHHARMGSHELEAMITVTLQGGKILMKDDKSFQWILLVVRSNHEEYHLLGNEQSPYESVGDLGRK